MKAPLPLAHQIGPHAIEWSDATWNPTRGCRKVSPGCANCYAMRQAHRQSGPGGAYEGLTKLTSHGPEWTGSVRLVDEALRLPLTWRKPRRVFVDSMSDLFHEDVPDQFIDRVFAVMALVPQHTFQVLTKRPERMAAYLVDRWRIEHLYDVWFEFWDGPRELSTWPLPNVWLGVSVEDQARADERIPWLLQTPAAVRFLSCEPLLGALNLRPWLAERPCDGGEGPDCLTCRGLQWVIAGGESGPGARPAHPDWFRSLRDQCAAAGVPFFFKQWGDWRVATGDEVVNHRIPVRLAMTYPVDVETGQWMRRVGKRAAGRLLDGRTWDEMPAEVR